MSVKLIMRDITVQKRQLQLALEVHCDVTREGTRAPRVELVFENEFDDRRMVMPIRSFIPSRKDKTGKKWIAKAKYTFFLKNIFWYGNWDECRLHFDVDYDGVVTEAIPFTLKLRKTEFNLLQLEAADEGEDDEDSEEILEIPDSYTTGDNYIDIKLGEICENEPPVQPNKIQVILGILLRLLNGLIGLLAVPWYLIDVIGIILLPTERKDHKLDDHGFISKYFHYLSWRYFSFCRNPQGGVAIKRGFMKLMYQLSNAFHRNKKNILFFSNRRDDLTGNFEFVHSYLEEDKDLQLDYWLDTTRFEEMSWWKAFLVGYKCGKAKVILVDDFTGYIRTLVITEETDIIQLWHACGAFKTFGFSRLGKKGGPKQRTKTHRDYDYCFVSSSHIAKYYAEGFGLSTKKVLPYGVPRTDMFFDDAVKETKRSCIYENYPALAGKKVILFAPTFRGNGKGTAMYDVEFFDPNKLIDSLPEDYALIIKLHPFIDFHYRIREDLSDRIYDFSEDSEINDLLFVTDVLITDYSSVIYEASLLNIPMLFFAYDLEDYISNRDFYFDYERNVPGKIVTNQDQLADSILNEDFQHEKVDEFCRNNFDDLDGKSSERIANFIHGLVYSKREDV